VKPLIISAARRRELVGSLLLVFSGLSRFASEVAQQKINNLGHNEHQLLALRQTVEDAMELMVDEGEPIHRIGELPHESWMLKRGLATSVTNDRFTKSIRPRWRRERPVNCLAPAVAVSCHL
jgi:D-glycero-alpha-D-manno-heptose-7-phosphate kinase